MNALILAATAEEPSGLSVILPEAAELFYGAISFAIVFLVLSRFAFPRIGQLLDDRAATIQGRMEEAERSLADAQETKGKYEAQLNASRAEANKILEDAKAQAEQLRAARQAEAEQEAQAIRSRAQADAAGERERLLQELRSEVGALSVSLASKIVARELDAQVHQNLVDQYIQELSQN